ncbi:hypothetical protein DICVIV_07496 [Dictyocaulus viviparus]|uniref:Uncharacterized protein n=1 Tax=Dictyocaulus viviparus TaxID=29172 RepID=A0A0D8XRM5_DICVI|nr:hypothetical protein DICVIV_07496 [Dictyocaulus viviparus]
MKKSLVPSSIHSWGYYRLGYLDHLYDTLLSCFSPLLAFQHCSVLDLFFIVCLSISLRKKINCRNEQKMMDACVEEKLGLTRPKLGYFSKLHVHESIHPRPENKVRDYKAEAAKVLHELPDDYHFRKDYRNYNDWRHKFWES